MLGFVKIPRHHLPVLWPQASYFSPYPNFLSNKSKNYFKKEKRKERKKKKKQKTKNKFNRSRHVDYFLWVFRDKPCKVLSHNSWHRVSVQTNKKTHQQQQQNSMKIMMTEEVGLDLKSLPVQNSLFFFLFLSVILLSRHLWTKYWLRRRIWFLISDIYYSQGKIILIKKKSIKCKYTKKIWFTRKFPSRRAPSQPPDLVPSPHPSPVPRPHASGASRQATDPCASAVFW